MSELRGRFYGFSAWRAQQRIPRGRERAWRLRMILRFCYAVPRPEGRGMKDRYLQIVMKYLDLNLRESG